MARKIFLVGVFLLLGASSLLAQGWGRKVPTTPKPVVQTAVPVATETVPEPAAAATNEVEPAVPIPVAEEMTITPEGEVSLDFRDADIQNVLKILSYKSGVNIVAGPEVTGLVTIKLNNVPWKQALEVVLQTYGYASEQRGNVIVVTTVDSMKKRREDSASLSEQEILQTRTYILNFAKAAEVIASIEKMRSERGSINFDERTNTVIVRDTATNLDLIEQVIKKLDAVTPQVMIEAKIIETNLDNTKSLGIDWNVQSSLSGIKRPTTYPFESGVAQRFLPVPTAAVSAITYGTLDFSSLTSVLKMIETRTDTNVLSNPRIVTLDNQSAKIEVGDDRPIPSYTYNDERGTFEVSGFTWRTIGIIFTVTPHVNSAGFVTLELHPEVSSTNSANDIDFGTNGIALPVISKKTVSTRVMVKDGETLVIGGLITDEKVVTKKKVPILGDIPLLGLMFRGNTTTVEKRDLLIFLTPHIITPDISANKDTR